MEFFIDNILYIAFFLTISSLFFLFIKNKKIIFSNRVKSTYLTDSELKLRAYERLTVFLERIEPIGMINRLELHALNKDLLKATLIKNIIIEYEYNISQQIYVSDELWSIIDSVKNKTINIISFISQNLSKEENTDDFVRKILENTEHSIIIKKAQKILKQEVRGFS